MHSAMTPSIGHNCVFYPIFDHHIYIQDKSNISSTQFLAATSHQLSLIKMQNGEYFSLYFFCYDALNMLVLVCVLSAITQICIIVLIIESLVF